MFSNNEETKLNWMYKNPNTLVNREEYLLGRAADKTLEELNKDEKTKELGIVQPRNHVEHECIPPSIRDYNKIIQNEQVDLTSKLQEDPLVAIRLKEEETRKMFLQNPIQLKKLQKALSTQTSKKKKSKKSSKGLDIDEKIKLKLWALKSTDGEVVNELKTKNSKDEATLDTLLMYKFNHLKRFLTESDLNDIMNGNLSSTDSSDSTDEEEKSRKTSRKNQFSESSSYRNKKYKYDRNRKSSNNDKKRLNDDEIERKRREMQSNAAWRNTERKKNIDRYKEQDKKSR